MEKLERLKNLVEEINYHNYKYYSLDTPEISDAEWDKLYDELLQLEGETGIILPNSPTKRVGGEVLSQFKKHTHKIPLYSLEKCNDYEVLNKWLTDVKEKVSNASFFVEFKYDGLTICVTYKNGLLVNASTRGNGLVGEDVTEQVKTIRTVPLQIDYKGEVIVQGEAIMKLSELKKYNATAEEPLKNARNAAAGAIRNLNPKITRSRNLDVIFYSVNFIDYEIKSQFEMHEFLKKNKFNIVNDYKIYSTQKEVLNAVKNIEKLRNSLDFLIDGAVVKLNNTAERNLLGYTSKFPKWAIAFKYEAQEISTKILDVVWQVGRTGKITPIAMLEPVNLAGVTVKRATLNNCGDIQRKNVKINDLVFVRRSNDVIPEILGVAKSGENSVPIQFPNVCPSCKEKLSTIGANLFCTNAYHCPKQIVGRLSHYASRDAMNLVGLSEKTSEVLHEKLKVNSVADLYKLKKEQIVALDGFLDKRAENLMLAIENSKQPPLNKFIYSLGIPGIGKKSAKDLASNFKTFKNFQSATFEQINAIFDFGDVNSQNIIDYFSNSKNIEILNNLFESGVCVQSETQQLSSKLSGLTFVLTGTLPTLSREEATALIEANGGNVSGSVSSKTNFILLGENPGSKLAKANKLGIKTISENELMLMIK